MDEAAPWLPRPHAGELETLIAKLAAVWLAPWIGARSLVATGHTAPKDDTDWHWLGCPSAMIGFRSEAAIAIGLVALDEHADLNANGDRAILAKIGHQIFAEFARSLCAVSRPDSTSAELAPGTASSDGSYYELSGGGWSLMLYVDQGSQCYMRLSNTRRRTLPVLSTLSKALASEIVRIGCHLGRASFSAVDLKALGRGDLIVLDTVISKELTLIVEEASTPEGKAVIEAIEGASAVRITQKIIQDQNLFP